VRDIVRRLRGGIERERERERERGHLFGSRMNSL